MTNAVVRAEERDQAGLTLLERRVIQEIALTGDFKKAAGSLGITATQIRRMLRDDPQFKEAYDQTFALDDLQHVESELRLAVTDVAGVFNEAKDAELTRRETVTCPCGCGHKFTVVIPVADWATRLRAAEDLAKITRLWKDQRDIKVEGQVSVVHLSIPDQIALQALEAGRPIPSHVYEHLKDYARSANIQLPPNPSAPVVEAEFRTLDEEEDDA